ncbi:MAG TPA: CHASE3 domain-containing protein [Aquabacterium sp.]|nr:CHASE3 domain-containing protein [Aquabacterium sp.]HQC94872.1 CHASE3 domain-containing protein [Aquabacterium sp.]
MTAFTPPSPEPSGGDPSTARSLWLRRLRMNLRRSPWAMPLAMAAASMMLAISDLGHRQAIRQLDRLMAMVHDRVELQRISIAIAQAEASQRGYLLTGRDEDLLPYSSARDEVVRRQQILAEHHRQLGRANKELVSLGQRIDERFGEMELLMRLHRQQGREAALALLQQDRGAALMRTIDGQLASMLAADTEAVNDGLASVLETLELNRIGIASLSAISLLVLGMFLRQRHANDLQQDAQQRLIQAERDRLESEVIGRTKELTELTRHLETAREDERARLARELHDELGALLTAAKLDVARIRPSLQAPVPGVMPRIAHLVETLDSSIALKRRVIEDLRPSTLSNLGLKGCPGDSGQRVRRAQRTGSACPHRRTAAVSVGRADRLPDRAGVVHQHRQGRPRRHSGG